MLKIPTGLISDTQLTKRFGSLLFCVSFCVTTSCFSYCNTLIYDYKCLIEGSDVDLRLRLELG